MQRGILRVCVPGGKEYVLCGKLGLRRKLGEAGLEFGNVICTGKVKDIIDRVFGESCIQGSHVCGRV